MCLKTLVNLCCIFLLYVTFFSSFFLVFVILYVIFSSFCLNQHSYLQAEDKSNSVMCVSICVLLLYKVINFNKAISLYFFVRQYSRLINFLYFHCIQIHTHQSHSSLCIKQSLCTQSLCSLLLLNLVVLPVIISQRVNILLLSCCAGFQLKKGCQLCENMTHQGQICRLNNVEKLLISMPF